MSNPHGQPRRVSLGYILGFSGKPFKESNQPSPPRPKRASQLAELVASPGGMVEWTASDGRKGTLTGTGKPRLTAAALAKVPSNTRSSKAPIDAKDTSKKAASSKQANNLVDTWDFGNSGFGEEKKGSKKSVSKKAASDKEETWGAMAWDFAGSTKASQKAASDAGRVSNPGDIAVPWGPQVVATDSETKQDEKKDGKSEVKVGEQNNTSVVANEATAPDNTTGPKDDAKTPDDSNAWKKEQDEKMLQMKAENGNIAWDTIATNVGKPTKLCKERWKVIMPAGWKPNDAKKKSDKGDAAKKMNAKVQDQKDTNSVNGSKKGEDNKENMNTNDSWVGGFDNLPNENDDDNQKEEKKASDWGNWNDVGGPTTVGWDDTNTGDVNQAKDSANSWGNIDGATNTNNKDVGATWDPKGGDPWVQTDGDATAIPWDTPNQHSIGNKDSGMQTSNAQGRPSAVRPASAPRSNKTPSEAHTHRSYRSSQSKSKSTSNSPTEIELEPDDNFSADDLRLIARILQQDCSLIWNRLSWRFRDKTGRTLHPDVFEKKITGTVESKSSS